MRDADTIAAVATAPGRGAIGVVRVSGWDLSRVTEGLLGRCPRPREATYCSFSDARGGAIDAGVVLFFPAPRSFTGENILELQGHGGPVVLRLILERCLELGVRLAEPGEFTYRAFLNGKLDLAQAEAVADLIDASTSQAARSALRSLSGDFSRDIGEIQHGLTRLRTLVEATLDFPEEEIDFLGKADVAGRLQGLRSRVDSVLSIAGQGRLLRDGIRVVLAGRPNVGKSSLLNRLAGEEVAIVTEHPGTTRDLIRQDLQLKGIPLHIVDSAGLREATDPVERIGIERTWRELGMADVVILVTDSPYAEATCDTLIEEALPEAVPRIRVHNKIDSWGGSARLEHAADGARVWVSAHTGAGLDMLVEQILAIAGWRDHQEGPYIARARHVHALRDAAAHLAQAEAVMSSLDVFAEELRLVQEALAKITGKVAPDALLGEIFARFCIGK